MVTIICVIIVTGGWKIYTYRKNTEKLKSLATLYIQMYMTCMFEFRLQHRGRGMVHVHLLVLGMAN